MNKEKIIKNFFLCLEEANKDFENVSYYIKDIFINRKIYNII